jgi:hypothetical protein
VVPALFAPAVVVIAPAATFVTVFATVAPGVIIMIPVAALSLRRRRGQNYCNCEQKCLAHRHLLSSRRPARRLG